MAPVLGDPGRGLGELERVVVAASRPELGLREPGLERPDRREVPPSASERVLRLVEASPL